MTEICCFSVSVNVDADAICGMDFAIQCHTLSCRRHTAMLILLCNFLCLYHLASGSIHSRYATRCNAFAGPVDSLSLKCLFVLKAVPSNVVASHRNRTNKCVGGVWPKFPRSTQSQTAATDASCMHPAITTCAWLRHTLRTPVTDAREVHCDLAPEMERYTTVDDKGAQGT